jgi:hypothetical protein
MNCIFERKFVLISVCVGMHACVVVCVLALVFVCMCSCLRTYACMHVHVCVVCACACTYARVCVHACFCFCPWCARRCARVCLYGCVSASFGCTDREQPGRPSGLVIGHHRPVSGRAAIRSAGCILVRASCFLLDSDSGGHRGVELKCPIAACAARELHSRAVCTAG